MNNIPELQNTEKQIQRLAAQRQLYVVAKKVFGSHLLFSGPITVVLAFLVLSFSQAKGYVALWGLFLSASDLLWLTPWQQRLRDKAASVQELFDCDVLEILWHKFKAGKPPDPELIKEQSTRYWKRSKKMPPLKDWYSPEVGSLPLHVARLACQRSNCWWDAKLRRRYALWIIVIFFIVFISVLAVAMGNNFTLEDFVLKVAVPLMPTFLLAVRQFTEQMKTATRLDKLKDHAEDLWNNTMNGASESESTASARVLQDEIFENRKKSPLVFDSIYKWLQQDYEEQMCHGAMELVAEAKQRLKLL